MAPEEDLPEYLRQTLPRLVEVGALGAFVGCAADDILELRYRPPCDQSRHERFFGLVRPDGSLKPHAQMLKEFAAERPVIQLIPGLARLTVNPGAFYGTATTPQPYLPDLYQAYLSGREA